MFGRDELILIAELGAAYAGFLAIFLIFARKEGRFSPADSLRIRTILISSFQVIFGALLPLVIALFQLPETLVWRVLSGVGLATGLLTAVHIGSIQLQLSHEEKEAVGLVHSYIAWGLSVIVGGLYVANVFGFWGGPSAGLYIAGLVCVLGIATSNFVTIAFKRLL